MAAISPPTPGTTPKLDGLALRRLRSEGRDFYPPGSPAIVDWIKEAIEEGETTNREDPGYSKIEEAMSFVLGDQLEKDRPAWLPQVVVNRTKKAIRSHASALTDLRPLFSYRCSNPAFTPQSELLNQLVVIWWVNTMADLELGSTIKYALAAGSGDLLVEYEPKFNGGDNKFIARDPRDTLPIRPTRDRSVQSWEGVIVREARTFNYLVARYPDKFYLFNQKPSGKFGNVFNKFQRVMSSAIQSLSPRGAFYYLEQKTKGGNKKEGVVPELALYRVHLKDRSRNMTTGPLVMGDPTQGWSYTVPVGEPLYPHGRLMLWTEDASDVVYDGPSPYWHGMFPLVRFQLDPWPWCFLGLGLAHDAMPLQRLINSTYNDLAQVFSQWVNRVQVADKSAVPESWFKRFDPRKPNAKVWMNPAMGEGFKFLDGPQTPPWTMQWMEFQNRQFDEVTGVANLQAILQARQVPSADTIQKYYEALTPEIRLEGRMIEAGLREAAQMLKTNIFQFYTTERRIMLLGDAGLTKEDLDFDPKNLVPAMSPDDPGFSPDLAADKPASQRAQFFQKLFTFYVAPNSLLAVNAIEQKMMKVQLFRMGVLDMWTLMEALEVPNVGNPPPVPLPDFNAPPQPVMQQTPLGPVPVIDPTTGQPATQPAVSVRMPITIPERLMAQQILGIGVAQNAAGRKASGETAPHEETKGDGRTTISESK